MRTIAYNVNRNHTWEVFLLAKTANLYARIEPELKEQAEAILTALGIPASNAITMFYRQIILQQGLPFDVKLPSAKPVDLSRLTPEQLAAMHAANENIGVSALAEGVKFYKYYLERYKCR